MDKFIVRKIVNNALEEDLSWGDITTENLIPDDSECKMTFVLRKAGVIAGLGVAEEVFRQLEPTIQWETYQPEGVFCEPGTKLALIQGNTHSLLKGERVALNFLQRMSGIATLTYKIVKKARQGRKNIRVVDTRKTTPGIRYLEKYAVQVGGGYTHRYNLSDAVLIKDNHLAILKAHKIPLKEAIHSLSQKIPHTTRIEIEIDSIDQIETVIEAGADIILLDNMDCDTLRKAVHMINGRAMTEASGGVTLDTVEAISQTGVDLVSVGRLTHSAKALDIGLDFQSE